MRHKIENELLKKGFKFQYIKELYNDYKYKVIKGDFERIVKFSKDGNYKLQVSIIDDTYNLIHKEK